MLFCKVLCGLFTSNVYNFLFRPLHHNDSTSSFSDVLSNLERFQHRLQESRERAHLMRSSTMNRYQRLHRRQLSRSIITDGPLVTDDMLNRSLEPVDASTPELSSTHDSVVLINEVKVLHHHYTIFELCWLCQTELLFYHQRKYLMSIIFQKDYRIIPTFYYQTFFMHGAPFLLGVFICSGIA